MEMRTRECSKEFIEAMRETLQLLESQGYLANGAILFSASVLPDDISALLSDRIPNIRVAAADSLLRGTKMVMGELPLLLKDLKPKQEE